MNKKSKLKLRILLFCTIAIISGVFVIDYIQKQNRKGVRYTFDKPVNNEEEVTTYDLYGLTEEEIEEFIRQLNEKR